MVVFDVDIQFLILFNKTKPPLFIKCKGQAERDKDRTAKVGPFFYLVFLLVAKTTVFCIFLVSDLFIFNMFCKLSFSFTLC